MTSEEKVNYIKEIYPQISDKGQDFLKKGFKENLKKISGACLNTFVNGTIVYDVGEKGTKLSLVSR